MQRNLCHLLYKCLQIKVVTKVQSKTFVTTFILVEKATA